MLVSGAPLGVPPAPVTPGGISPEAAPPGGNPPSGPKKSHLGLGESSVHRAGLLGAGGGATIGPHGTGMGSGGWKRDAAAPVGLWE